MVKDAEFDYSGLEKYELHSRAVADAVLCDLDGTLCLRGDRSPYDYSQVINDTANRPVLTILNALYNNGLEVIFLSGRPESCREDTERWLMTNFSTGFCTYVGLFMRPDGDNRRDWVVKEELFTKYIRHNYNIICALDDRNQVVDMWRAIGLTCLQVAEGNF